MTPERWKIVEKLFNAAIERDVSQREAFLLQACKGDEDLRREVESLLRQEKPAERFLESSDVAEAVKEMAKGHGNETGELIGKQLGSYKIVSLVEVGGMGEVYRPQDTRLHRTVAVKVLPAHQAERSELGERFEREARSSGGLLIALGIEVWPAN